MDDHDRGLAFDLTRMLDRRGALRLLAVAGAAALGACRGGTDGGQAARTTATTATSAGGPSAAGSPEGCDEFPASTAGPFPADGSNGPNVLDDAGIVRQDIRSSIGSASGVAEGLALTVSLKVVDGSRGCAPLPGAAVYLWHCDREGRYSVYDRSVAGENYLRGVQAAGPDGVLTFTTVFPGAYPGRWPHMHFEVFSDVAAATSGRRRTAVSQLALPADACRAAYQADGYGDSARALSRLSLESDGVFRGDAARHLATASGDPDRGMAAQLTIAV